MTIEYKSLRLIGVGVTGSSSALTDIYTTPANTKALILSFNICRNDSITSLISYPSRYFNIKLKDTNNNNVEYWLMKNREIASRSSLEVIDGQKIVLNAGEGLRIFASHNGLFDVILSLMEVS